jgi:hypothetical protein
MTRITLDTNTSTQLHTLQGPAELCDPFGRVLGRFVPLAMGACVTPGERGGIGSAMPTRPETLHYSRSHGLPGEYVMLATCESQPEAWQRPIADNLPA